MSQFNTRTYLRSKAKSQVTRVKVGGYKFELPGTAEKCNREGLIEHASELAEGTEVKVTGPKVEDGNLIGTEVFTMEGTEMAPVISQKDL